MSGVDAKKLARLVKAGQRAHRDRVRKLLTLSTKIKHPVKGKHHALGPRVVMFLAEGAMPYAAPLDELPDALRTILGIELGTESIAELEKDLAKGGGGKTPALVFVDGIIEIHTIGFKVPS